MKGDVPNAARQSGRIPYFADKYAVERVLGRGGMGTVFEACHVRLGHRVAIKVLGEDLRGHPELVQRFEREARAAGELTSSHAVKVFDIDQTENGTPYMVMELLDGRDLAHLVEHDGPQPIGAAVRWIVEACDAIAEAHGLGIIHRDIKPSNLFLCAETGSVKVLDFGIAKRVASKEAAITQGVAPLGTPQYMSPEQVRCAADIDARSDIWSLGITLYELVCGRPPFNHDIAQACIAAIVVDPVPDPREFCADLPAELAAVIMRALDKDPEGRFPSIDELVTALRPFADESAPCEDESWRGRSARRLAAANRRTTLGTDDGVIDLDFGRRAHHEELTVPPAVSPTRRATREKRIRSSLVVALATLLGLGAFVASPRWVGMRVDETRAESAPSNVGEAVVKAAAVPERRVPESETAPAQEPEAPKTETVLAESVVTGVPPVQGPSAKQAKPAKAMKASPARPSTRAPGRPSGSADRAIHGGISSPGF